MTVTVTRIPFTPQAKIQFNWTTTQPDPNQVRKSSFGLPYREPQPVDAPTTLLPKKMQQQVEPLLREQWGANDVHDVRRTCEQLLGDGMHTPMFDAFLRPSIKLMSIRASSSNPVEFGYQLELYDRFLQALAFYQGADPDSWLTIFHHWINLATSSLFQDLRTYQIPETTRAWDLLRIEAFAGNAVGCGWMDPAEYDDITRRTVLELQKSFNSWTQVAVSFWWGRAMWLCDETTDPATDLCVFNKLFTAALTNSDSPWVRVPLLP